MMTQEQYEAARCRVREMLSEAGVVITDEEAARIEVADFGLGDLERVGLQLITYVNTDRVCAKELILFPRQTCPEHRHPAIDGAPGKEETFRCRWGTVYLYVPGESPETAACSVPAGYEPYLTERGEVRLGPGQQYTLPPDMPHWFQAGEEGAIVSEFSTRSRDEFDIFTDPRVIRAPRVFS